MAPQALGPGRAMQAAEKAGQIHQQPGERPPFLVRKRAVRADYACAHAPSHFTACAAQLGPSLAGWWRMRERVDFRSKKANTQQLARRHAEHSSQIAQKSMRNELANAKNSLVIYHQPSGATSHEGARARFVS